MSNLFYFIRRLVLALSVIRLSLFGKPPVFMLCDSWGSLTVVNFRTYPIDLVDWLRRLGLKVVDASVPGRTIKDELKRKFYRTILRWNRRKKLVAITLGLGGNDVFGSPESLVLNIESVVDRAIRKLRNLCESIRLEAGEETYLVIVVHGYDYVNAKASLPFYEGILSDRFGDLGMTDEQINELVIRAVDRYNEKLAAMAKSLPYVEYVDLRGTLTGEVSKDWIEDIHPTPGGYKALAEKLLREMQSRDRLAPWVA